MGVKRRRRLKAERTGDTMSKTIRKFFVGYFILAAAGTVATGRLAYYVAARIGEGPEIRKSQTDFHKNPLSAQATELHAEDRTALDSSP